MSDGALSYVVRCAFDAAEPFERFVEWLRRSHVDDVCRRGAEAADIVRLDRGADEPYVVEVRYRFASRESFARYEREEAPKLRQDGLDELARLGVRPGHGVTMTRATGVVVTRS